MIEQSTELYNALSVAFEGFEIFQNLAPKDTIENDSIVYSVGIESINMFLGAKFYEPIYSARVFIVGNDLSISNGIEYLAAVLNYNIMGLTNDFNDELQKVVCNFTIMFNQ